MKTFIIAEAGVNHNGSLDVAMRLVDAAVEAGVDAVKFQTFKADKLATATAERANYQIASTDERLSQLEMLKNLELPSDSFKELCAYCKIKGILFLSTPFDEESADMLSNLGMGIFKIPSGEITNRPLIQHIAAKGKNIILSTGMSFLGEVEKAIGWIRESWNQMEAKPYLILMHCVSSYPADTEDTNLSAMHTMSRAFNLPVGYSDHTMGIEIPIAAVAMGACAIEKHFTLSKDMNGPDHKASLEPEELKQMVQALRKVEIALGDGVKRPVKNEEEIRGIARKSLIALKDIKRGDVIRNDMVGIKRPGTGIPPEFKEMIIGMTAGREVKADALIKWEDLRHA